MYDAKKNEAIKSITEAPVKKKAEDSDRRKRIRGERDVMFYHFHNTLKLKDSKWSLQDTANELKDRFGWDYTSEGVRTNLKNATKYIGLSSSVSVE